MNNDLISIIVPIYNVEDYLEECLNSLLEQTYENIEIILIDDGSTDNSKKICDNYEKNNERIKCFHIENNGVSYARNFGLSKALGKWITFVDSDDVIDKNYCKYLINVIDEETDMVIGRTLSFINNYNNIIDDGYKGGVEDSIITNKEKEELYKSIFIDNRKLIKYPHISTCSAKLIKRDIIQRNHILYDLKMFLYEDAFFNIQVINKAKRIKLIDKKIYYYRIHENSSSNKFRNDIITQYNYVYDCFNKFEHENNIDLRDLYDYFKIKNLNIILTNYFKDNNNLSFVKEICQNEDYKESLNKISIKILPKRRKILVMLYKLKMYCLIRMLYKIK